MTAKREAHPKPKSAKVPRDFASDACATVADELEHLAQQDEFAFLSTEFEFAVAVLREIAAERDPRKLIDRRAKMESLPERAARAVMRAIREGRCGSYQAAFEAAGLEISVARRRKDPIDTRTIEGAWNDFWTARGVRFLAPWELRGEPPKRRPRAKK